ncbi:MAG: arsenate reductase ArsC [Nocardioides sp.]
MTDKPSVLFMCVHNAGRSQMAAGYLRTMAGDRIEVLSAGSRPGTSLNPVAVEAMAEEGIDISAAIPQFASEEVMRTADVVITMGCGDECTYYPGKRYLDWPLDDPAGQGLEMVRGVRDDIKARVEALMGELLTD